MDLLARGAGGEAKIKAVERLDRRKAGKSGEHLARADPTRVTLTAQKLFEEVGEGGGLGGSTLGCRGREIGNGAEPQLAAQFAQPLMLQNAHPIPPTKTS